MGQACGFSRCPAAACMPLSEQDLLAFLPPTPEHTWLSPRPSDAVTVLSDLPACGIANKPPFFVHAQSQVFCYGRPHALRQP